MKTFDYYNMKIIIIISRQFYIQIFFKNEHIVNFYCNDSLIDVN